MTAIQFQVEFESGPMAVREALSRILLGLRPLSLGQEQLGTVEIVLAETLNNVVEHAYPIGDPPGRVVIACAHHPDGLHFRVVDHGRPMPQGHAPIGERENIHKDPAGMPEGGFGWFLIRDLAREVRYARTGQNNVLDLRLAVAKAA